MTSIPKTIVLLNEKMLNKTCYIYLDLYLYLKFLFSTLCIQSENTLGSYRHVFFMFLKHVNFIPVPFPPPPILLGCSPYSESLKKFLSFSKLYHLFRISLSASLYEVFGVILVLSDFSFSNILWHRSSASTKLALVLRTFMPISLSQVSLGKEPGISLGLITNRA